MVQFVEIIFRTKSHLAVPTGTSGFVYDGRGIFAGTFLIQKYLRSIIFSGILSPEIVYTLKRLGNIKYYIKKW